MPVTESVAAGEDALPFASSCFSPTTIRACGIVAVPLGASPMVGEKMNLNEATQLTAKLVTIEALMRSIKALWNSKDFPSVEDLAGFGRRMGEIHGTMKAIIEKDSEMPTAHSYEDLGQELSSIYANLEAIIEKAEEMPVVSQFA
jgi:hypothetical protein